MQKLILDDSTRSERRPWSWTKRNESRAEDILNVVNSLRKYWPLTERQIYYRLISSDAAKQDHWFIKGRQVKIYNAIGRVLKWMRIDERLPWRAITDEHRATTPKIGFTNVEEFVDSEASNFLKGYARCMAQKQKNYIEIWIEKAALLHIVKPIADDFCRRVVVCRGYNSITFQTMFYQRASDAINAGQQPTVLYFGDWDPSGVNMIYTAIQTLTDELGLWGVKYYRCGINPEHFDMIASDPVPIKWSDTRSKRFVPQYGATAYELDAFHPEQLQGLVRESIEAFTDMSEYDTNSERESTDLEVIDRLKNQVEHFISAKAVEMGIW
jgi:hypothetical protein